MFRKYGNDRTEQEFIETIVSDCVDITVRYNACNKLWYKYLQVNDWVCKGIMTWKEIMDWTIIRMKQSKLV